MESYNTDEKTLQLLRTDKALVTKKEKQNKKKQVDKQKTKKKQVDKQKTEIDKQKTEIEKQEEDYAHCENFKMFLYLYRTDICYARNYDINLVGYEFGTLKILKYLGEVTTEEAGIHKENDMVYHGKWRILTKHRVYLCQCFLCGAYYNFSCEDLVINKPVRDGDYANVGYWSRAVCRYHMPSSFELRTRDILTRHGVCYRVEQSYTGLVGVDNKTPLRYDFTIYDQNRKARAFIECQGEQHYRPVEYFGGLESFDKQQENDNKKREFASYHNIPLIELPFDLCNTYKKEEQYLSKAHII